MAATNKTVTVTGEKLQHRRHVVCLPSPAQSHIGAMLKLAKLLHHRGFYISFVNTEFNHRRLLEAQVSSGFIDNDTPRGFQFLAISDGLPPSQSHVNASQSLDDMFYAARHGMVGPFCDLIGDLKNKRPPAAAGRGSGDGGDYHFPAVSCIVSDGFMNFSTSPAASKYELPIIYLWTISACALMGFKQYGALVQRDLFPLKDDIFLTNGYLDTIIDWIPGMKDIRLRDLPSFIRTTDPDDAFFKFAKDTTERSNGATATIIHTFEALEQDVLDAFSSTLSGPVYAIGPLHVLLEKVPEEENHLKNISCNLWKENMECLQWLNTQKDNSVIYINFGSVAHLTHQQLVEFAMGIANSKQPFLWIVRPDLVMEDATATVMPEEFIEETRGRGLVSGWCPQEEVLNHLSIGGFLTHCGWNSIIESLSAGVPMLCWPWGGDQQTNCRYTCVEWQAGIEIQSPIMRDEVESLVRELMVGEKRSQLKMNAMKWKKLANHAADPHGSSSMNLDRLFEEILPK